jgi:hypothetical protein
MGAGNMTPDWQWIPPTIAALAGCSGLGMFLWRIQGSILRDIKDRLDKINGSTRINTTDIAAIKAGCKERHYRRYHD